MRIFEFYFNPKIKSDLVFESFCYEPENIYERRVGSLYMVGAIKNALPKSPRLLDELSKIIKDRYYTPIIRSPEKSFKESLKRGNSFLERLVQQGDVSWLGNLSFASLAIKKSKFNFSKVGNIKTFLIRGKKITDLDKKIKFEDIEPYPLKVFLNIVSGKLNEEDVLMILSKDIADFFEKEKMLEQFSQIPSFEEKEIMNLFNTKKSELQELSGVCLIISFNEKALQSRKKSILVKPKTKEFSLKKALAPLSNSLKQLSGAMSLLQFKRKPRPEPKTETKKTRKKQEKPVKFKMPRLPVLKINLPSVSFSKRTKKLKISFNKFKQKILTTFRHKNVVLITALIVFLSLGYTIFQRETAKQLREYNAQVSQVQQKIELAEGLLILETSQSSKEAQTLLIQAWEKIEPITKIAHTMPQDFQYRVSSLEKTILSYLYQFNNLEEIKEPELVYEFKTGEFVPQKMALKQGDIYFFSPYVKKIFRLRQGQENQTLESIKEFHLAAIWKESVIFFSRPNQITNLKEGELPQSFLLEYPYLDFEFNDFSIFNSNLYFLDKKAGQIIKYPYLEEFKWDFPQLWLNDESKQSGEFNSLAIDGSVWILTKNSINKYSGGSLQQEMGSEIFPQAQNLSKIITSPLLSYLYVLEPTQKRIIILSKTGETIKQFKSEEFDNLLDFAVSQDGKIIYLLNGLKVYKIQF